MYFAHFGLARPPFEQECGAGFFYRGERHGEALSFLGEAFESRHLLVVLSGPAGSGKTETLDQFVSGLSGSVKGGWLPGLPATAEEFLEALLEKMGFPPPVAGTDELRSITGVYLGHQAQKDAHVVIAVRLRGAVAPAVVEEMAWLGTLEPVRAGRVKLVLIGDENLERVLDAPRSRALGKLIRHRARLEPLNPVETLDYLEHRLQAAGSARPHEPFTEEAAALIHKRSGGLPGQINELAEAALETAWRANDRRVRPGMVAGDARASEYAPAEPSECLAVFRAGAPVVERPLVGDRVLMGRHIWNDLQLDHGSVSRHHALAVREDGGWVIVDLNSTNGIAVNGRPVKMARLSQADVVTVGEFKLTFRGGGATESGSGTGDTGFDEIDGDRTLVQTG